MKSRRLMFVCAGAAGLSLAAFWASAGPLAPPAGPVSSTSPSLASLEASINAISSASAGPADTSTLPGDATDGRPLMVPGGQSGMTYRVEVAGQADGFWDVVEFSESIEVVEQTIINQQGQQVTIPVPGRTALPRVLLVRDFEANPAISDWWDLVKSGNVVSARTSASIVLLDDQGFEIARWNIYDCWPSAYDHRAIDGQWSEQLMIVGEFIERVSS
jgi:hypothetical protein